MQRKNEGEAGSWLSNPLGAMMGWSQELTPEEFDRELTTRVRGNLDLLNRIFVTYLDPMFRSVERDPTALHLAGRIRGLWMQLEQDGFAKYGSAVDEHMRLSPETVFARTQAATAALPEGLDKVKDHRKGFPPLLKAYAHLYERIIEDHITPIARSLFIEPSDGEAWGRHAQHAGPLCRMAGKCAQAALHRFLASVLDARPAYSPSGLCAPTVASQLSKITQ